tara:strand:- start:2629 stop:3669 length:1041 start_codon:yes stop_codon:yes gene_type:complete
MPNFFVDSNKQKAANEALARGEKDYMQTGLKARASNTTSTKKSGNRKFGSFRYPVARLDNDSDYLEVKIVEYKAPGTDVSGTGQSLRLQSSSESLKKNIENPLGTIFLPVPETVTDSNGVTWGESSLDGISATGVGLANDLITSGFNMKDLGEVGNRGQNALNDFMKDDTTASAINARFASMAVKALGGSVDPEKLLSRQTGSVLNPNMELLFNGVQLRSFNFDFDLVPRDENESAVIKNIIRTFKKSMNAKSGSTGGDSSSGLFIKSPDVFKLTYKTGKRNHQFLHKFKPMALLNMAVNYTGAGTYATYDNTAPVHMKINLSFQELNPIYSEDYETKEGQEGTGF